MKAPVEIQLPRVLSVLEQARLELSAGRVEQGTASLERGVQMLQDVLR